MKNKYFPKPFRIKMAGTIKMAAEDEKETNSAKAHLETGES